jgi:hypothetical protein
MFLSDWRLLLRRWYVVVAGALATLALCFAASHVVPIKYQATSGILLLPPPSTAEGVPDNPFLSLGGLDTVSGVVSRAATDRSVQAEVAKAGGTGSYTVVPDVASGGPVLLITVEDVTPQKALTTLRVVSQKVPVLLSNLQTTSGVRPNALIRSRELIRDNVAQPVRKPLIRALIVAMAAGLAGTVLLASLLDGFLARRRDREDPEAEPAVTGGPDPREPDSLVDEPWERHRPPRPADRREAVYRRDDRDRDYHLDYEPRYDYDPRYDRDPVGRRADHDDDSAWVDSANAWADGVRGDFQADPGVHSRLVNGSLADEPLDGADPRRKYHAPLNGTKAHIPHAAANGSAVNGVNGTPVDGANGTPVNGTPVDAASNGEPAPDVLGIDEPTRIIRTDKGTTNGAPINGKSQNGYGSGKANGSSGAATDGAATPAGSRSDPSAAPRTTDPSRMPWWASPSDPDPTEVIEYNRVSDPDPTVEIAYDRLAASLREMQDEHDRTESG